MKITEGGVRYCASCYGLYPDRQHVDLEADYDGAAIKQENGDYQHVGDLILCENCLTNAGKLIGLFPLEDLKKENEEMGVALESKSDENKALLDAYKELRKSFDSLADDRIKGRKPVESPKVLEIAGISAN